MSLAAVAAVIAIAAGFAFGDSTARAVEPAPPNVIVIMSDDQAPGMMKALPNVRNAARRARDHVRERVRHLPALLSGARHAAHRRVRAQPRHARQQPGQRRRLPGADRPGPDPGAMAAGLRLRDRLRRQMAERTAYPAPGAAGLGPVVGADRRGRRRSLVVLRLRPVRAGRDPAPLRHRDRGLPDRRAHARLRSAVHRRRGRRPAPVLPLALLPPAALRARSRRRRRAAVLGRPAHRARQQAERDPAGALRRASTAGRRCRTRPRSTSATSPTSRSWCAATRPCRATSSRRSSATTAAGLQRCGRSTMASARSSTGSGRPASSRTR